MQVDPKLTTGAVSWVDRAPPTIRQSKAGADYVSLGMAQALDDQLRQTPDAREEAVARARELVVQATYPPPETIKRLAALLAMEIATDAD
jgi:hypothetical protein